MGSAIAHSLVVNGFATASQLWGTTRTADRARSAQRHCRFKCTTKTDRRELKNTSLLFLCVKPAQARGVLNTLVTEGLSPKTVVVSIVTGLSLADIESALGRSQPIVRAISNTPLLVNEALTALAANPKVPSRDKEAIRSIFSAMGTVIEVEEPLCDALTGLSASGPAYLYLIMEALADGGVRVGLGREQALQIVAQTVRGAATMLQRTGRHPASLRDDVTTPSGCTIAGLLILEDGKIRSALARAVEEAAKTAARLGREVVP